MALQCAVIWLLDSSKTSANYQWEAVFTDWRRTHRPLRLGYESVDQFTPSDPQGGSSFPRSDHGCIMARDSTATRSQPNTLGQDGTRWDEPPRNASKSPEKPDATGQDGTRWDERSQVQVLVGESPWWFESLRPHQSRADVRVRRRCQWAVFRGR